MKITAEGDIVNWANTFLADIRYSLRQFLRKPMFSAVAIVSLGLGIGAITAIFSLMNAMLLGSLPVRDPQQLVMLTSPSRAGRSTGLAENERSQITYPEFLQLRQQLTTFSGLCVAGATLQDWHVRIADGDPETVFGKLVSEEYFSVLGVEAAIGHLFNSRDARGPGGDPYVVISHDFWQRRFDGRADVLGTKITLNGATLAVIGVAARGFQGESVARTPDLWIPMLMQPSIYPGRDWLHEDPAQSLQKVMWLNAFGRLKHGANLASAQSEVNVVFSGMMQAFYASIGPDLKRRALSQYLVVRDAHAGTFPGRDAVASELKILLAMAGVVLLMACANVANLLLGRATGFHHDISVRFSLGASRWRVYRQLLTQSLLLWVFGGIAGLLISLVGCRVLATLIGDPTQGFNVSYGLDWRVLGFTAGVALLSGVLFGVVPALRAAPANINIGLRDSGRSVTQTKRRRSLAKILVIGQVGLSFLLTVESGLLIRTIWNLQSVPLGFSKERLLQVDVDGVTAGYKDQALVNFYNGLAAQLSALPGIRGVGYSRLGLLTGGESRCRIQIEGTTPQRAENRRSHYDYISPGYFSVLGVSLVRGRDIAPQDTASSRRVCVINEEFAKRLFPGQDPIGRHITALSGNTSNTLEVVGVVKNVRSGSLRDEIPVTFYTPVQQPYLDDSDGPVVFQIRSASDAKSMVASVRQVIRSANPNAPILLSGTLEDAIADQTLTESQIARLCSIFCVLALVLGAVGLYGVLSDGVARRINEIGTRMAVGASPANIILMVLSETAIITAIGLAAGLLGATLSTGLIASYLFGLRPLDGTTIAFAFALVSTVALFAGYIPAYRAGRVDPVIALRHE